MRDFDTEIYKYEEWPELDAGIAPAVMLLREAGFGTFTSCQGGEGHAFEEPTIRFLITDNGDQAVKVLMDAGYLVSDLRRITTYVKTVDNRPQYSADEFWEIVLWQCEPIVIGSGGAA